MKKTGEYLRQEREKKGLSLHEIGLSLKINSKILAAIEDGDLSKLPAKTFLRGFVQSYSNYLKADTDTILALFAEEMGTTRPQPEPDVSTAPLSSGEETSSVVSPIVTPASSLPRAKAPSSDAPVTGIEESSRTKAVVFSLISVVLVVLIYGTSKVVERYQKESIPGEVEVASPLEDETEEDNNESPESPLVSSKETPVSSSTLGIPPLTPMNGPLNSATVPVSSNTPLAEEKKPEEKKPEVAQQAAPAPTPPAPTAPPVSPPQAAAPTPPPAQPSVTTPPPVPPPAPEEKKPTARRLELIIEALDQVEVEYSSLNGSPKKIRLSADQVHTIRSTEGIKLGLSNGGAVNLILNGRDLGVPGDLGKPVSLSY